MNLKCLANRLTGYLPRLGYFEIASATIFQRLFFFSHIFSETLDLAQP